MSGAGSSPLEPAYLPGVRAPRAWHEGRLPSGRRFRVPRLDEGASAEVARRVREAALQARARRSLEAVVRALGATGARFGRAGDALRREAIDLVGAELGWSEELAAETLAEMAGIWTEEALWSTLRGELEDPAVLERWVAERQGGRRRRAWGPPLLLTIHAGNVPGVAVTAAIRALLVRSGSLNRVASDEPGLLGLFARGLAEADPLLAGCVAATWWPADRRAPDPAEAAWVKRSGKVIVYGGDEAVLAVRGRLPARADLVAYGPRLGVAVLLPDAVSRARPSAGDGAAGPPEALARDALAYEGRGCVTPRLVFALGVAEDARRFAGRLAKALAGEASRIPRPAAGPDAAVAIRSLRARYEFASEGDLAAAAGSPAGRAVWGTDSDLSWTVVLGAGDLREWELLPGVVTVVPIGGVTELERLLQPLRGRIQAVGYAGEEGAAEVADACARLGVARLAPLGTLAWPPADWRHDGRGQLQPLLEWTDWEARR